MALDPVTPREGARGPYLSRMPLPVDDRERMHRSAFPSDEREAGRRVHASREEDDVPVPGPGRAHPTPPHAATITAAIATAESIPRKFVAPFER